MSAVYPGIRINLSYARDIFAFFKNHISWQRNRILPKTRRLIRLLQNILKTPCSLPYTKDSRFDPNYIHPFDKLFEQLFIYMEEIK